MIVSAHACERAQRVAVLWPVVTHPSRLETRTKEFNMQASLRVQRNPKAQ